MSKKSSNFAQQNVGGERGRKNNNKNNYKSTIETIFLNNNLNNIITTCCARNNTTSAQEEKNFDDNVDNLRGNQLPAALERKTFTTIETIIKITIIQ